MSVGVWLCVCVCVWTWGHESVRAQLGWSHVPHAWCSAGHTAGTEGPSLGHTGWIVGVGGGGPRVPPADIQGYLSLPAGKGLPKLRASWFLTIPSGEAFSTGVAERAQAGPRGRKGLASLSERQGPALGGLLPGGQAEPGGPLSLLTWWLGLAASGGAGGRCG